MQKWPLHLYAAAMLLESSTNGTRQLCYCAELCGSTYSRHILAAAMSAAV